MRMISVVPDIGRREGASQLYNAINVVFSRGRVG